MSSLFFCVLGLIRFSFWVAKKVCFVIFKAFTFFDKGDLNRDYGHLDLKGGP